MRIYEYDPSKLDEILKNREIIKTESFITNRHISDERIGTECGALVLTLKPVNDNEKPERLTVIPSDKYGLTFFVNTEE